MHSDTPQHDDPSSVHRLARVRALPRPSDLRDILAVLGDTQDKDYPIYRTPRKTDPVYSNHVHRYNILLSNAQLAVIT